MVKSEFKTINTANKFNSVLPSKLDKWLENHAVITV